MPTDSTWERALRRYADRVYRLALLRDPRPDQAARATAAAFRAIDWKNAVLDDQLEGRLVAALPPPKRTPRRPSLSGLPAVFWQFPATTRLALGLRLTRGYGSDAIAAVLDRPVEEVRRLLLDAIARLAGDDPAGLSEACRACRLARLDGLSGGRDHLLDCAACQAAAPHWAQTEQSLAEGISRATGATMLPRAEVEALSSRLRGADGRAGGAAWLRPELLQALLIVAVVVAVAAIVLPRRGGDATQARPPTTARGLLAQALERYGSVPAGEGIVHRRYHVEFETPRTMLTAESWTDAERPERHRMQVSAGQEVWEWQVGDGSRRLRYLATTEQFCSPEYGRALLDLGVIHTWEVGVSAQAAQRATRWQFGPWALGRRYLEQALQAETLRSLGTVGRQAGTVVTLAAEGRALSGTLLLDLDAGSGELREVREVREEGGTTRARTPWRLLSEEQIPAETAQRAGIFLAVPVSPRPQEVKREQPLLDPACPALAEAHIASPAEVLATGWSPVVGLDSAPPNTERIFLTGQRNAPNGNLILAYIGATRRLVMGTGYDLASVGEPAIAAGNWQVRLDSTGPTMLRGSAWTLEEENLFRRPAFTFAAEGWSRDELLQVLGTARTLRLADAYAAETPIYDPDPPPAAVLDLLIPAAEALEPRPGRAVRAVIEHQMRAHPLGSALRDPYHAKPLSGTTEFWVAYGEDGRQERFRTDHNGVGPSGSGRSWVEWGDGEQRQIYYPELGVVEDVPAVMPDPLWRVDQSLRQIFRYRLFEVSEDGSGGITLSRTIPFSETDLVHLLHDQRLSRQPSFYAPWMADLLLSGNFPSDSVTFQTTFDRSTKRVTMAQTWMNVLQRKILLERTIVHEFETLAEPSGVEWTFTPPTGTPRLDVSFRGQSSHAVRSVQSMAAVVDATPVRLWGWPDDDRLLFMGGLVPAGSLRPSFGFQQFEDVLDTGAAVQLHYAWAGAGVITLTEGHGAYLKLSLWQTPPEWTQSQERTIQIAGADRPAWVMRDDGRRRWVIFELDEMLIVVEYQGDNFQSEVLPALAELEPLTDT